MLHLVQELATPHNNTVIQALHNAHTPLTLWYCKDARQLYGSTQNLTNAILPANIYSAKCPSLNLLSAALKSIFTQNEQFLIVGWSNPTTRTLMLLFWLTRHPYNMWFDMPNDNLTRNPLKKALRHFFYFILRTSKAHVFGVGQNTLNYFHNRGFAQSRLTNLSIYVDLAKTATNYTPKAQSIRTKYNIKPDNLFLAMGSHLVHDKGYDLALTAIAHLPKALQAKTKAVIIGNGTEAEALHAQAKTLAYPQNIHWEKWLNIEDFRAILTTSDVFIHPARFDAYGGGTLNAMMLSTPVIGSLTAGSAPDRIAHGKNGFLYNAEDTKTLAKHITWCHNNKTKLKTMGKKARTRAEDFTPKSAAQIIKKYAI